MRVAAGGTLLLHGVQELWTGYPSPPVGLHVICAAMGMLLVVGLWTPVVGTVAAIAAAMHAWSDPADARTYALLAALAGALALLGPGRWSVDARLFGWRRVEIRDRSADEKRRDPPL
ncbi:MAG: hypothetical protein U1F15_10625 [Burkholderiales bacterium]